MNRLSWHVLNYKNHFFSPGVPSPTDLDVSDIQDQAIVVRWTPARGPITGYRVTGKPKNGVGPTFSKEVGPGESCWICHKILGFMLINRYPGNFLLFVLR